MKSVDLASYVARALHNAEVPLLCDWAILPYNDTDEYGIGKGKRLEQATAAIQAVGHFLLENSVHL